MIKACLLIELQPLVINTFCWFSSTQGDFGAFIILDKVAWVSTCESI